MASEKAPLLPGRTTSSFEDEEAAWHIATTEDHEESTGPSKLVQVAGCAAWIALGVGFACYFEGWSVVTGLYVVTQIVTTVGYGDVTVTSQAGKLFCGMYVVITVVFIATYVTELATTAFGNQEEFFRDQLRRAEAHVVKKVRRVTGRGSQGSVQGQSTTTTPRSNPESGDGDQELDELEMRIKYGHYNQAAVAFFIFVLFVLFGTFFFAFHENCTCSYGVSRVEGCVEKLCAETGGYQKTLTDAFYMSLITLTTVGFGDNTPKSWVGRVVGCFWMMFGVISCANMAGKFAEVLMHKKKEEERFKKISRKVFNKMDVDHDGFLSMSEFRVFALIKFGVVSKDSLDRIDYLFKKMDVNKDGKLTFEEVEKYQSVL